jgi:hypothetical protein
MTLAVKPTRRSSVSKREAIEEATREPTIRLNALIPASLHKRLKLRAIEEGSGATVTAIIIAAADEYLRRGADESMSQ